MHGSGETNTHIQITEALVDRLIELGKRFDYMTYPNRDHGLSEGPGSTLHVRNLIARYLIEHLPPGPRPTASPSIEPPQARGFHLIQSRIPILSR
jgi:dipeptidyl-peptidase-4